MPSQSTLAPRQFLFQVTTSQLYIAIPRYPPLHLAFHPLELGKRGVCVVSGTKDSIVLGEFLVRLHIHGDASLVEPLEAS